MAFPRRLLGALLASISNDLQSLHCVDLTLGRVGAGLLPSGSKAPGRRADLVLVDASRASSALSACDADTLVLVLCDGQTPEELPGLQQRSKVQAGDVTWRLCVRALEAEAGHSLSLSVVMPAQDQAPQIERLVHILAAGPHDLPVSLVVVDCGSIDHTGALLRSVTGPLKTLTVPRHTTMSDAIQRGLDASSTTHAMVLSPLWVPEVGWEEALFARMASRPEATAFLAALVSADGGNGVMPRAGALGSAVIYRLPVQARGLVVPAPEVRIRVVPSRKVAAAPRAAAPRPGVDASLGLGLRP